MSVLDIEGMDARTVAEHGPTRDALYLVSKNVPFDVAFSLDDATRLGFVIILGEMDGQKWNWSSMAFDPIS